MKWTANDILQKRAALSRWNPSYKEEFERYMEAELNTKL